MIAAFCLFLVWFHCHDTIFLFTLDHLGGILQTLVFSWSGEKLLLPCSSSEENTYQIWIHYPAKNHLYFLRSWIGNLFFYLLSTDFFYSFLPFMLSNPFSCTLVVQICCFKIKFLSFGRFLLLSIIFSDVYLAALDSTSMVKFLQNNNAYKIKTLYTRVIKETWRFFLNDVDEAI